MSLPTLLTILFLAFLAIFLLTLWAICKAGGEADDMSEVIIAELQKAKNESHP
jgi:hypothetical protein